MIGIANRADNTGLATNIAVAVGAVLLVNGLIFGLGWDSSSGEPVSPSFAPPGYVVAAVWVALFAAMAAARWLLLRAGGGRVRVHDRLVVALLASCLAYPFFAIAPGSLVGGLIGNLLIIALALFAAWNVRRASAPAATLILPVAGWVSFATVIVVRTLQLNA